MEEIDIDTYQQIKLEIVEEFAERLIRYYKALNDTTHSSMVVYHIREIVNDVCNKKDEKM